MSDLIKKVYSAELQVEDSKREVLAVISTDAVDRDKEVVLPKGLKRKNYAGNPVVFLNHDWQSNPLSLPIGKSLWVKADGNKILAKTYISDKTQLARDVFGLLQDGVLNAFSVGFLPLVSSAPTAKEIKARPDWSSAKSVIREWDMIEYSVVGMPCNPEALALAVSKGYSKQTIDMISGKAAATAQAAAEVVAEIKTNEEASKLSKKELIRLLSKRIEGGFVNVDVDAVVSKALKAIIR
jgi:phage head maturation protease